MAIYKASLGPRHAWVAIAQTNLAVLLELAEDWDGLRVVTDEALAIARENWTDDHWRTQALVSLHGVCLGKAGRWSEAEAELRSSRDRLAALLGPDDPITREADRRLATRPSGAGRAPMANEPVDRESPDRGDVTRILAEIVDGRLCRRGPAVSPGLRGAPSARRPRDAE